MVDGVINLYCTGEVKTELDEMEVVGIMVVGFIVAIVVASAAIILM